MLRLVTVFFAVLFFLCCCLLFLVLVIYLLESIYTIVTVDPFIDIFILDIDIFIVRSHSDSR